MNSFEIELEIILTVTSPVFPSIVNHSKITIKLILNTFNLSFQFDITKKNINDF